MIVRVHTLRGGRLVGVLAADIGTVVTDEKDGGTVIGNRWGEHIVTVREHAYTVIKRWEAALSHPAGPQRPGEGMPTY